MQLYLCSHDFSQRQCSYVVTEKPKNRIVKGTPMKKLAHSIAGGKACTIAKRSLALPSVKSALSN